MGSVSTFDVAVLIAVIGAAFGGFRTGSCRRLLGWVGIAAGIVVGAQLAPFAASLVDQGGRRALAGAAAASVVGALAVGRALGTFVGASLRRALHGGIGRSLDGVLGAILGVGAVVVGAWFVAPALRSGGPYVAGLVDGSRVAAFLEAEAPTPPDPLDVVASIGGEARWSALLAALDVPGDPTPPAAVTIRADVVDVALAGTVRVERAACHRVQEGTGFVIDRIAGQQLVLTNAHVVAGVTTGRIPLSVRSAATGIEVEARVVMFDPVRDIAVLAVPEAGIPTLALALGSPAAGTVGQLYGHPGGRRDAVVRPFRVDDVVQDVLPDIYGAPLGRDASRPVLIVAASIERGDSGSPLVTDGGVIGMAFALTVPDDASLPGVALAVGRDDLAVAVEQARAELRRDPGATVVTGGCVVTQ
jgi:S1-C subfamily serine protease